jgi:hypothetical protein
VIGWSHDRLERAVTPAEAQFEYNLVMAEISLIERARDEALKNACPERPFSIEGFTVSHLICRLIKLAIIIDGGPPAPTSPN